MAIVCVLRWLILLVLTTSVFATTTPSTTTTTTAATTTSTPSHTADSLSSHGQCIFLSSSDPTGAYKLISVIMCVSILLDKN